MNIKFLSFCLCLLSLNSIFAQEERPKEVILEPIQVTSIAIADPNKVEVVSMEEQMEDNTARGVVREPVERIYVTVEQVAEFPGGQAAMMRWIADQIRYPEEAMQQCISGRVIVKMVIEKDGSVSNPKVVRGVSPELDQEAIRVIESMPKWTPGRMNGEIVRSYYTLPVTFRLPEE